MHFRLLKKGEFRHGLKLGVFLVAALEFVIRDAAVVVVDVVVADAAAEPLEDFRQFGANCPSRTLGNNPTPVAAPVGVLVLMLDVEEPRARAGRQERHRHLDQQEVLQSDREGRPTVAARSSALVRVHAAPFSFPGVGDVAGVAVFDDELKKRADQKHGERVPVGPVFKAFPTGRG